MAGPGKQVLDGVELELARHRPQPRGEFAVAGVQRVDLG
jgi:hypothetical protein